MNNHFDIGVIGGGPAGMMAAGTAARLGAQVVLIEKNERPGKKLLLTGKGRCNITNAEDEPGRFIETLGKKAKFLYPALHLFGVRETIVFFNERGLETKVERGNRVFPVSNRAADVLEVLLAYLRESGVTILTGEPVTGLKKNGQSITKIFTTNHTITADKYILCTGGRSYPGTGSAGDGLEWLEQFGHTIIPPTPSLTPLRVKEKWVDDLQDLTLKNVRITVYQDNKKQDERFGEAQFVRGGIGGPIVLDMSRHIGRLLQTGPVQLAIDFKPALEYKKLDNRIQRDFLEFHNKMFKNSLDKLLPKKIIPLFLTLSGIDPSRKINAITKDERKKLIHLFKELPLNIKGLFGFEKALITAGGVSLKEIEPHTMCSKRIDNLYFAGEVIDLDGPTGGYNLQICWSTGYTAGKHAASALSFQDIRLKT
jgi:predicted Rossmann fold flavoprotein